MKYSTTISKFAFAAVALLVVAACATSAEVPPPAELQAPTEPEPETKVPPAPAPAPTSKEPEKKCVTTCATDSDCANSCPATAGAVQCCDLKTKTCYGAAAAVCPKQEDPKDPAPAY